MADTSITVMNTAMAAVWWHACTRPTATRGHRIPPKRAIELANPTPVALTAVGYICSRERTGDKVFCVMHRDLVKSRELLA